jgi:hypothetical protein
MPKHSDEDKARFRDLVPEGPGVEVKPMFGSLGAFVNGNMFAGLFGTDVGIKLDEAGLTELRGIEGSGPFGPAERPMGGSLSLVLGRGGPRLGRPGPSPRRDVPAKGQEEVTGPVSGIRGSPSRSGFRRSRQSAGCRSPEPRRHP